jgi:hypothetical protein
VQRGPSATSGRGLCVQRGPSGEAGRGLCVQRRAIESFKFRGHSENYREEIASIGSLNRIRGSWPDSVPLWALCLTSGIAGLNRR